MVFWSTYFSTRHWGCRKYKRQMNCWGTLNGADSTMMRVDKRVTGMLFCIKRCYTVCEGFVNAVWTLWMLWMVQPFTPETYENQWKSGCLWRREHFFGAKNTYRYVWRGRWVGVVGMKREQFFTTRRFVVSTQGLEETSPGLENTSRRVVKTNPGLVCGGGRWRM